MIRALSTCDSMPFITGSVGAVSVALCGGLQLLGISLNDRFLSADPDLLIFVGLMGFGGLVGARYGGEKACSLGLFLGCAVALVATVNIYFLAVANYSILMDHDLPGYLLINDCRTPGYWAFLSLFRTYRSPVVDCSSTELGARIPGINGMGRAARDEFDHSRCSDFTHCGPVCSTVLVLILGFDRGSIFCCLWICCCSFNCLHSITIQWPRRCIRVIHCGRYRN